MKKLSLLIILVCFSFKLFSQSYDPNYQDGKIWFRLKNDVRITSSLNENPNKISINSIPGFEVFVAKYGVTNLSKPFYQAKRSQELQLTYLVEFTNINDVESFIKDIEATKKVDYAEKVPLMKTCLVPNDPSFSSQWFLNTINAPLAWNLFSTGSNIKIAIVDDAVERTHPDLSPNLWVNPGEIAGNAIDDDGNGYVDDINGYDVGSGDNNPNPPTTSYDHGTHVAGCASARSNNSTGVASIGFSCKLMAIKATTTPTAITHGYEGIVYAVESGANVINCSWGGPGFSTTGQTIVTYAWNNNCIVVAAAGNDNVSSMFYPAALNNVISVAATQIGDSKASFSNYGSWIDISAPGNNIYSTTVSASYGNKSGTSMASPIVSGLIGLMWSLNPGMPKADLINCLYSTATNINAANPSFIGQLGAGRINANAAMTCVSATLANPPVADFVANITSVTAGGSVVFTDLSTYAPTSWSWSFPGGTPATFTGAVPPPITYATPGTYNVQLTATNVNGSDVELKTAYINVTAASGCQRINLPLPSTWTPVNYGTGTPIGNDGWVNGPNIYGDREKAMYFDASSTPYTILNNVWVAFGLAHSTTPSKQVRVRVYDGTAGPNTAPGAQIGTDVIATMGQIMADVDGGFYTEFSFVNNPVTLPASKRFFVSVDISALTFVSGPGTHDTLNIVSNTNGQTSAPIPIWDRDNTLAWNQYTGGGTWNLAASLLIHPFLTTQNTVSTFTTSSTTVCQGSTISFNGSAATFQDTLLWVFNGGTPLIVSSDPTVDVIYNTPGTYNAIQYVVGGGCGLFDSSFVTITVNANPVISASAASSTVCPGGNTTLTASGAVSYVWSPATFLSGTTGPSVTTTPTSNITYNVMGTAANGCTSNAVIDIEVWQNPIAVATVSDTVIGCTNTTVFLDGSLSNNVSTFTWTFTGGGTAINTSTSAPSVDYTVPGTYTGQLITSNSCSTDTATVTFDVILNNSLNAAVTASIASGDSIDCNSSVTFDGTPSVDESSYAWIFAGGSPATSTLSNPSVTYNAAGGYVATLIVTNACGSDTTTFNVNVRSCSSGLEDELNGISGFYQAPIESFVIQNSAEFNSNSFTTLYNDLGQVLSIYNATGNTNQMIVPVSNLRAGMYIIQLHHNGYTKSFKFVITK